MKIAIVGSREGFKEDFIYDKLNSLYKPNWEMIVTGGARGVDEDAEHWANYKRIPCKIIRPDNPAIKSDYIKRNYEIVDMADEVIAFWNGKSKGTMSVIIYASNMGKTPLVILRPPKYPLASGYIRVI